MRFSLALALFVVASAQAQALEDIWVGYEARLPNGPDTPTPEMIACQEQTLLAFQQSIAANEAEIRPFLPAAGQDALHRASEAWREHVAQLTRLLSPVSPPTTVLDASGVGLAHRFSLARLRGFGLLPPSFYNKGRGASE